MTRAFEIYEDRASQYRWRLVAENGEIVADSGEGYSTAAAARDAVERVRDVAPHAPIPEYDVDHFDVYEDRAGQYRWRLVASNGLIIADSGEGYESKSGARTAAEAVADRVIDAEIET